MSDWPARLDAARPISALLLLLVVVGACSNPIAETPPVQDSVMVDVLVDLHLAERRHALEQDVGRPLRDSILTRHCLDADAYAEAMQYYAAHPDRYAALYGDVVDRLRAARERLDTLQTAR